MIHRGDAEGAENRLVVGFQGESFASDGFAEANATAQRTRRRSPRTTMSWVAVHHLLSLGCSPLRLCASAPLRLAVAVLAPMKSPQRHGGTAERIPRTPHRQQRASNRHEALSVFFRVLLRPLCFLAHTREAGYGTMSCLGFLAMRRRSGAACRAPTALAMTLRCPDSRLPPTPHCSLPFDHRQHHMARILRRAVDPVCRGPII
jgi:hypothetical protein